MTVSVNEIKSGNVLRISPWMEDDTVSGGDLVMILTDFDERNHHKFAVRDVSYLHLDTGLVLTSRHVFWSNGFVDGFTLVDTASPEAKRLAAIY